MDLHCEGGGRDFPPAIPTLVIGAESLLAGLRDFDELDLQRGARKRISYCPAGPRLREHPDFGATCCDLESQYRKQ